LKIASGASQDRRFVSGHGFSRAVRHSTKTRALAPAAHESAGAKAHELEPGPFGTTGSRALTQTETTGEIILPRDGDIDLILHGGEEYELLFTARPNRRIPRQIAGIPITQIGEIVRGRQMKLARSGGRMEILQPAGWEHFG